MRGISSGAAAVQALGDAVTGGRGRVTKKRRARLCSGCSEAGHDARACPLIARRVALAAVRAAAEAKARAAAEPERPAAPLRKGFIAWRSLTQDARGKHATLVDHSAVDAENKRWKNLAAHWLDGCPCAACEKARGGR